MVDHSDMPLGRLPVKHDPKMAMLANFRTTTDLSAPLQCLFGAHIPSWGDLGNISVGDCTAAAKGHALQSITSDVRKLWSPSTLETLQFYSASTGYKMGVPSTDKGGVMTDVLKYLLAHGFCGRRIASYGGAAPTDRATVKHIIYAFNGADVGIALPACFSKEDVWGEPTPESEDLDDAPGSWGLHCIYVRGFDAKYVYFISWGKQMKMTWDAWDKYVEEVYGVLWAAAVKNGTVPAGFDVKSLIKYAESLRA